MDQSKPGLTFISHLFPQETQISTPRLIQMNEDLINHDSLTKMKTTFKNGLNKTRKSIPEYKLSPIVKQVQIDIVEQEHWKTYEVIILVQKEI